MPDNAPGRWRGMCWRAARAAALVYLGVLLVLSMLQTWLIFPGAATQGRTDAIVPPMPGTELTRIQRPEGEIAVLFGSPIGQHDPDQPRPTVLFFYGNGMCMADAIGEFNALRRRGANVVLADYCGYGMSGGEPGEAGVYAAAEAAYDVALRHPDVDPGRIVPVGWSLGAAAALHLASTRRVAGVATLSAFTSMSDMARRMLPGLPVSLVLKHRFENERMLERVTCPVFIAHGTRDSIIPCDMSDRLARAAGSRLVAQEKVDGADHNDLFEVGGDVLLEQICSFIERACDGAPKV